MSGGIDLNYINAYGAILDNVPELKEKIETGKLKHSDILKIARSVIIEKRQDGSFIISKNKSRDNRNFKVAKGQLTLIRKICDQHSNIPGQERTKRRLEDSTPDVSLKSHRAQQEENIDKKKSGTKRKSDDENPAPTKKLKVNEEPPSIKRPAEDEIGDFFKVDSGIPDTILGLMSEYIEETPTAVVDFAYEKRLPEYLKNSTHLDLSNEKLTHATFLSILNECKKLQSLKLPKDADDFYLEELANKFPNLKSLDISKCNGITDVGLNHIANRMNSIETLVLSDCQNISDEGVDCLIQTLEKLKELDLSICSQISDEAFNHIEMRSETLRHLNLSRTGITDKSLVLIANGVKDLQTLCLKSCGLMPTRFTHVGIDCIIQNLTKLQKLDLSSCNISDNALINISKLSNSLKVLCLQGCHGITGSFMEHLDNDFTVLEELDLSFLCYRFKEENLTYCAGKFPALKTANFGDSGNITSVGVISVVQGAKYLENLSLKNCVRVSDECLKFIADNCPNLQSLNLHACKDITNSGIESIATSCQGLLSLNIFYCPNVDDNVLKVIASNCHRLSELNLSNCHRITNQGLGYISERCPNLRKINLDYCREITEDGIKILSQGIKSLQSLDLTLDLSPTGLLYISEWKDSLEELSVKRFSVDDKTFVNFEHKFPLLHKLELSKTYCLEIGDLSLSKFPQLFPALESLDLSNCRNITDTGIGYLKALPKMEKLLLHEAHISGLAVDHIIAMPMIKSVILNRCFGLSAIDIERLKIFGITVHAL